MSYYPDLRSYLDALEQNDLLTTIDRPIIKETQLASLVRLQYRGLPEEQRKGFLFQNVIDVNQKQYAMRVATGICASSRKMYALALKCEDVSQILKRWSEAQKNPIQPRIVKDGPVHEEVHVDGELEKVGTDELPVPVELPGFSGQIRTTFTAMVTKDPETGIRNVGNYSGHIFGRRKILAEINKTHHGNIHLQKCRQRGMKNLQAAIVIGALPPVYYTASATIPYGIDEYAIVGGLVGEPLDLVKCKTVDLEVPATAEIVIEGEISTEYMEPGNAFGEYTGYMALDVKMRPVFNVTAITHRRNAIFTHIISQMPPSESSITRNLAYENIMLKFLKYDCGNPAVMDVGINEMSQDKWLVIKLKKTDPSQVWQALNAAVAYQSETGKIIVAVDDDIDPRDPDSFIWAMSWRMQPHRDVRITRGRMPALDPSGYRPDASHEEKAYPEGAGSSAILIDATTKWPYPPTALPKKEYMEEALKIWTEEGLPQLNLKEPWFGYELGYWPTKYEEDAQMIVRGEHKELGKKLEEGRKRV